MVAIAVRLVNWFLVGPLELHPMIASLATYTALRAISLMLQPTPEGLIDDDAMDAVNADGALCRSR